MLRTIVMVVVDDGSVPDTCVVYWSIGDLTCCTRMKRAAHAGICLIGAQRCSVGGVCAMVLLSLSASLLVYG